MNRRPIPLALVALLTASTLAAAQTPPPKTIDLDLTATSVADYAAYLRNELGENIVVVPERGLDPAKVILPPITLKQLSPQDAIDLLRLTPDCAVAISTTQAQGTGKRVTIVNLSSRGGDDAPEPIRMTVFPLEKLMLGESPKDRVPDDAEREKTLSDRAEQLLVLAEQTFAMVPPSGERPEFRYHAPTHTLLVKATEDDANRVQQLIQALIVPNPSKAEVDSRVQARFERVIAENQQLRGRYDALEKSFQEAQQAKAATSIEERMRERRQAREAGPTTAP